MRSPETSITHADTSLVPRPTVTTRRLPEAVGSMIAWIIESGLWWTAADWTTVMTAASASSAEDERASAADVAALSAAPSPQLPARGCAPPEVDPKATAVSASFVAETPPKGLPTLRPPYLSVTDKNGVIDVRCVRGQLDCSTLTVTIPSGTPSEPLRLTIESSKYGVHASGTTATVASLVVRSTGHGDVAFDVAPTLGASIDITGYGNLMDVTLPPTFAADEVTLINHDTHGYLDVTDFPGLDAGSTFGPAGTGVKLLRLDATFDIAVHKHP